ncbi:DUF4056 domain-containing protein [Rosenbergiella australiborealis]|uniref:DUF4056 domain-containing protein n=1 Tax=Rosenbergiella australiborealis TaxID=1544696 RepID=UPI001F4D9F01|nr:DUF4056 domain-containing protein [Rosenbergiella australiborealis]
MMIPIWRGSFPYILATALFFLFSRQSNAAMPDLTTNPAPLGSQVTTLPALKKPEGLRPCCAFGHDLQAELKGAPVPLYRLNNIVESHDLGKHRYNDSIVRGLTSMIGGGSEKNGIVYTQHGGFIDTAHVRDSMDMTYWVASQLLQHPGSALRVRLSDELAHREIVLHPYRVPRDTQAAFSVVVWTAARVAFDLAAWHEIAQWYGFESVPGFSEGVSAFSPEDLYSNLVGVRLAASLLLSGQGAELQQYNQQATQVLTQALDQLGAVSRQETARQFDRLDGQWWDSQQRVPNKWLVLHRNYSTDSTRRPTPIPGEPSANHLLALPEQVAGVTLDKVAALQLLPARSSSQLPVFSGSLTRDDFPRLAQQAEAQDTQSLSARLPASAK